MSWGCCLAIPLPVDYRAVMGSPSGPRRSSAASTVQSSVRSTVPAVARGGGADSSFGPCAMSLCGPSDH